MTGIKFIKDFKSALKDFEPYVKNPNFLIKGRGIYKFFFKTKGGVGKLVALRCVAKITR